MIVSPRRPLAREQLLLSGALVLAAITVFLLPVDVCGQGRLSGSVSIDLSVSPQMVPADGKSRARIRIQARDRAGNPVPDGTRILCTTDLGLLQIPGESKRQSLTVGSTGGYATVYCTSSTAGTATVTVRVRDSRQEVSVQFLPKGEAARAFARMLKIHGAWVGYCPDLNIIRARDGVTARIGDLKFEGVDKLEVDIGRQTLCGWGGRITAGDEEFETESFYYELNRHRGILRCFGEYGVERICFDPRGVHRKRKLWQLPANAFTGKKADGVAWLVCDTCMYFIGQKVVVKDATFYTGIQKVFDLPPYWVIGLPGYTGTSNTQVLGLSSDGGLAVDLPLFYRVSEHWAGAVKIQHGAAATSFITRRGWNLGIEEEYQTRDSKGSIEANGLFGSDWGIEWQDERQVLDGDQAYLNVAWPDHRNFFVDGNLYHYADDYRFNLRTEYENRYGGGDQRRLTGDWLTDPAPLSDNCDYRLGSSIGLRRYDGMDDEWVFENELYMDLQFDSSTIGSTTIRPGISNTYVWETGEYSANRFRTELRMTQKLDSSSRLGLNYYFTYRSGDTSRPGSNSLFSANYSKTHGNLWNLYIDSTWDATEDDKYAYFGFDYHFKRKWRLGLMGTYYDYEDVEYDDLEIELGRVFGNREVAIRYVVDSQSFSLELGEFGLR